MRRTLYKEALKNGFYTLLAARDSYRDATSHDGGMHLDLVNSFVRIQALLLAPIAPHVAEHMWSTILAEPTSIQNAQWPKQEKVDTVVLEQATFIRSTLRAVREAEGGYQKKKSKAKKAGEFDITKPKGLKIYVSRSFPAWQEEVVQLVKSSMTAEGVVDDAALKKGMADKGMGKEKRAMPFAATLKVSLSFLLALTSTDDSLVTQRTIENDGVEVAFNRASPFDEVEILATAMPYLKRTLAIELIDVVPVENAQEGELGYDKVSVEKAEPRAPAIVFYNTV